MSVKDGSCFSEYLSGVHMRGFVCHSEVYWKGVSVQTGILSLFIGCMRSDETVVYLKVGVRTGDGSRVINSDYVSNPGNGQKQCLQDHDLADLYRTQ